MNKNFCSLDDIINELECSNCERIVPNKDYFIKDKCLWCRPKGDKDGKK